MLLKRSLEAVKQSESRCWFAYFTASRASVTWMWLHPTDNWWSISRNRDKNNFELFILTLRFVDLVKFPILPLLNLFSDIRDISGKILISIIIFWNAITKFSTSFTLRTLKIKSVINAENTSISNLQKQLANIYKNWQIMYVILNYVYNIFQFSWFP